MISFELETLELIPKVLSQVKTISFAESLGGVESLITILGPRPMQTYRSKQESVWGLTTVYLDSP